MRWLRNGFFLLVALALCLGATNKVNEWEEHENRGHKLITECPTCPEGYQALMLPIQFGERQKAVRLAREMVDSSAPPEFKLWAKGVLNRFDLFGKPFQMKFTALDGRDVDLSKMQGRVVLIDFWEPGCLPSEEVVLDVKAAYEKHHAQGFEVIGVAFNDDKAEVLRFLREKGIEWPQYFDGKSGVSNKYGQEFGIAALPHMLVVDKTGCLRMDLLTTRPMGRLIGMLMAEK
jgi:thiol-disulfide isomerase/thioredoxin